MKSVRFSIFMCGVLMLLAGTSLAQGLNEKEPPRQRLGAPVYPGAIFIRVVTGLDPYHESAEYITGDPVETALAFFERKLPDKRQITFEDKSLYLVAFLMKTWSKIPGTPSKDDLALLEKEPNLQIRTFDSTQYGTLVEYFNRKPGGKAKANALANGNTMIRYTYPVVKEAASAHKIVGKWQSADRDLKDFFGSVIEFRANGAYTLTLTPENLAAKKSASGRKTETGTYVIMNNTVSLETSEPVRGPARKSGIANAGRASLSLELIGMPRLTFIRMKK